MTCSGDVNSFPVWSPPAVLGADWDDRNDKPTTGNQTASGGQHSAAHGEGSSFVDGTRKHGWVIRTAWNCKGSKFLQSLFDARQERCSRVKVTKRIENTLNPSMGPIPSLMLKMSM